ncbi:hypothetical protein BMETH_1465_0 [methanotrophic bacterial endosymbiont of Bathymodiolus sp.]|nr:hypothetical protein BMETH_1465_0 [methanotrophic bacterial endosymbiont of Bathymodiolus sp.]
MTLSINYSTDSMLKIRWEYIKAGKRVSNDYNCYAVAGVSSRWFASQI